jgi:hypothetical protein
MSCELCKCPFCGMGIGLNRENHTVVFNPENVRQSTCRHLVYAGWNMSQWNLDGNGAAQLVWSAGGDWRSPQLTAAIEEHSSDYLMGEVCDLAATGINEQLNIVCPHEVVHGQKTFERPLTADKRAKQLPGREGEVVDDVDLHCVFAVDGERFVHMLTSLVPQLQYSP